MNKVTLIITFLLFLTSCGIRPPVVPEQPTESVRKTQVKHPAPERWKCLGPSGMPNLISRSTGYGVGQINRIAFDPFYDGITNQTVYACSSFGGLWRSENDGIYWENVNTDGLPSTSVADVVINPANPNEIFICTGFADGIKQDARSPNWAHINPLNTTGIFRSRDYGQTWEDISKGFIEDFSQGGLCREMVIDPKNPNRIFVATTNGIYRTENAGSPAVLWKNVTRHTPAGAEDFRGLELKPDDPKTLFISGTKIFRSTDGGNTWQAITGEDFGLDLENLPDQFRASRINIAVTPADPGRLYAYILGKKNVNQKDFDGAHIALFEDEQWRIIDSRWSAGLTYFAINWMAIAVSPVDADVVYYGNSRAIGSENIDSISFGLRSPYSGMGFHADIHDLKFQPNVDNPGLFCGNHGGVSFKEMPDSGITGWDYRNEGLAVTTIWAFDDSETDDNLAIIGTQDDGTMVYYDTLDHQWHYIHGGDGYAGRIDQNYPRHAYYSMGDRSFGLFDFNTFKTTSETAKIPLDARVKKESVRIPKTFPLMNHPANGSAWFGFTELYTKEIHRPTGQTSREEVWTQQSDISKTEPQGWKRQITEFEISPSDPDVIYVVTAGQQNIAGYDWQLQSGLYKSTRGGLNDRETTEKYFLPMDYPGKDYRRDTLAIITGIAVDPDDADRLWISFTSVLPQYRVWRSENGGKTWTNDDPEGIFAMNPANAVAIDPETRKLYLGTDRGLFVKPQSGNWTKIDDFPSVRVTEIKINQELNRIRAATFGRGLWEGPR
ncbi:MAG: hypothetical protein ACLFPE_12055 [Bacteroidales bacterium]